MGVFYLNKDFLSKFVFIHLLIKEEE